MPARERPPDQISCARDGGLDHTARGGVDHDVVALPREKAELARRPDDPLRARAVSEVRARRRHLRYGEPGELAMSLERPGDARALRVELRLHRLEEPCATAARRSVGTGAVLRG